MSNKTYPPVGAIEKAYIRGVKEGMRRGAASLAAHRAKIVELEIRLKTVKGQIKRSALVKPDA